MLYCISCGVGFYPNETDDPDRDYCMDCYYEIQEDSPWNAPDPDFEDMLEGMEGW